MPGGDPLYLAADMIARIVTLEALRVVTWAPILIGLVYLHARWMKKW
jgi:hypothetical protein